MKALKKLTRRRTSPKKARPVKKKGVRKNTTTSSIASAASSSTLKWGDFLPTSSLQSLINSGPTVTSLLLPATVMTLLFVAYYFSILSNPYTMLWRVFDYIRGVDSVPQVVCTAIGSKDKGNGETMYIMKCTAESGYKIYSTVANDKGEVTVEYYETGLGFVSKFGLFAGTSLALYVVSILLSSASEVDVSGKDLKRVLKSSGDAYKRLSSGGRDKLYTAARKPYVAKAKTRIESSDSESSSDDEYSSTESSDDSSTDDSSSS